jgi:hypothetical protein
MAGKTSEGKSGGWAFRARFRREAFGWRSSRLAIERIDEALAEIRAASRRDPVHGAEGAVLFLERLSPALSQVDSSSGALGSATYAAVKALVPLIAEAPASEAVRGKWLERLFEAIQNDDPPYIESLGEHWGELRATVELASRWADELMPTVQRVLKERTGGVFAWFSGTTACFSALFAARRHDELMDLLASDPRPFWQDRLWGGRVLLERAAFDEAIDYMQASMGSTTSSTALARFGEEALLRAGRRDEAYARYAIDANQASSHVSTYRAIAKKYPEIEPDRLLRDLIDSTPGEEGKWFATAKTLKRLDLAIELARASPCDPKTLTRAARDHLEDQPGFAMEAAMAALHWMEGYGYELTAADAVAAKRLAVEGALRTDRTLEIDIWVRQLTSTHPPSSWLRATLGV